MSILASGISRFNKAIRPHILIRQLKRTNTEMAVHIIRDNIKNSHVYTEVKIDVNTKQLENELEKIEKQKLTK